jgi:hypothetical protein
VVNDADSAALKLAIEMIASETFHRGISSRAQCITSYEIARGAADDGGWIGKRALRMKINIAFSTELPSP